LAKPCHSAIIPSDAMLISSEMIAGGDARATGAML
jgi:hypothetical protein